MNFREAGKLGAEKTKLYWNKVKEEYNLSPNKCSFCKIPLEYSKRNNKFCSRKCFSLNEKELFNVHSKYCLMCNNELDGSGKKYCSIQCQQDYQNKQKVENGIASIKSLKTYLIKTNGYICNGCGISEWRKKKIVLELEHKDGNSENNLLSNLELLCPNCHSQTDTYKAKNKGNGRYSRKVRYKENKSY